MFDLDKQKLLFELLLSSPALFAKCNAIVKPIYFDDVFVKPVKFIQDYFETYKEIPSPQILKGETGIDAEIHSLSKAEQDYAATEVEIFCQRSAAIEAARKSPELIEKGDLEGLWQMMKAAASISLNTDLGISYFDNPEARLLDLIENSPTMSTGWIEVDEMIGGGINEEELLLFAAASGVGKSVTMSNLAINLIKQGYNGIYISLELADRVVCKRFDSMTTGIAQADILKNMKEVAEQVVALKTTGVGELQIKRMPENVTTANHIRAYLKEYEQTFGYSPAFIVVDYLDLLGTNKNISAENIWLSDKFKAEELRAIAFEYKCAIITASQLGRSSWEAEKIGQQHIQGGISKIQTADIMISIVQSDQMRALGQILFEYTKTRNSGGVGQNTLLKWDASTLKIDNLDNKAKLELNKATQKTETILDFGKKTSDQPSLLKFINKK